MSVLRFAGLVALTAALAHGLWPEDSLRRALDEVSHRRRALRDPREAHRLETILRDLEQRLEEEGFEEQKRSANLDFSRLPSSFHQKPHLNGDVRKRARQYREPAKPSARRGEYVDDWTNPYVDLSRKRRAIIKKRDEGNQKLMTELGEILKDEKPEKKTLKKRQNDDNFENVPNESSYNETEIKNKSKRFVPEPKMEEEAHDLEEENEEAKKPSKENIPDWLKDEYYRTMAATFSTLRRKRSEMTVMDNSPDLDGRFSQVLMKLNTIEESMMADALELIQRGSDREKVLTKLSAAYDVDKIRESLEHLEQTLDRMEDSSGPPVIEEKRESRNMAEALSVMASKRSKGEESYEKESSNEIPFVPEVSLDSSSELEIPEKIDNEDEECPALDLLTSDCAVLGDVVPEGHVRDVILRACNWHELCYSCGQAYGMTKDDCDVGFVEQSRTICRDEARCRSAAKLMLVPLRQRRVFYKRSVPAVCSRQPCVGAALRQPLG